MQTSAVLPMTGPFPRSQPSGSLKEPGGISLRPAQLNALIGRNQALNSLGNRWVDAQPLKPFEWQSSRRGLFRQNGWSSRYENPASKNVRQSRMSPAAAGSNGSLDGAPRKRL